MRAGSQCWSLKSSFLPPTAQRCIWVVIEPGHCAPVPAGLAPIPPAARRPPFPCWPSGSDGRPSRPGLRPLPKRPRAPRGGQERAVTAVREDGGQERRRGQDSEAAREPARRTGPGARREAVPRVGCVGGPGSWDLTRCGQATAPYPEQQHPKVSAKGTTVIPHPHPHTLPLPGSTRAFLC